MIDLGEAVAQTADRRRAMIVAALVIALSLVAFPFGARPLGASPVALTMFLSVSTVMVAVSAMLLAAQARVTHSGPLLALAAAYAVTATVLVPSTDAATPSWLWLLWHLLFASCAIVYVAARHALVRRDAPAFARTKRVTVVLTASSIAVLLPGAIVLDGAGTPPPPGISAAVVIVVALTAIGLLIARDRMRSVLDLWLGVATTCMIADVLLVDAGAGAFTVGWYLSRVCAVVASGSVLIALIGQTANVYGQLAKTAERLRNESLTDMLTGLTNRRGFDAALAAAIRDGMRNHRGAALLMIDIDNFKVYNDTFGHPAGDRCLRIVAGILRKHANRTRDVAARFGGEELALIMPETTLHGATVVAERIRAAVEAAAIPQGPAAVHRDVTISVGVAAHALAAGESSVAILAEADRALYGAKQAGRNRVVTAKPIGFEHTA